MSIFDKIVGAITPPVSDETRMATRAERRAGAEPGSWLEQVLDHHDEIEQRFADLAAAADPASRRAAEKELSLILTAHANAEEGVLYPALAKHDERHHAGLAYQQQAMAKVETAMLETMDPMSQDYLDKLDHLRGAVTTHMYQEESNWFVDLKEKLPAAEQARLGERYEEEAGRYLGAALTETV